MRTRLANIHKKLKKVYEDDTSDYSTVNRWADYLLKCACPLFLAIVHQNLLLFSFIRFFGIKHYIYCWKNNTTLSMTVLFSPEFSMCVLRGYSVSASFVTAIGDQMVLRRSVFVPLVLSLHAVTMKL